LALAGSTLGRLSVIVATMIGAAGAGAGTGAGARLLVTVALLASLRSAGAAFSLGTWIDSRTRRSDGRDGRNQDGEG
jgi:hypothetical protein